MSHSRTKDYVWSFTSALVLVAVLIYLVRFSMLAGVLLSPGMMLATHIVPQSTWDGLRGSDTGEVVQIGKVSPWRSAPFSLA